MLDLDAATREIHSRLMGDFVGIWEVFYVVQSQGVLDVRAASEAVINELLTKGIAILGDLRREGFAPWPGDTAACLAELRARWDRLAKDPTIGDIGWLDSREG